MARDCAHPSALNSVSDQNVRCRRRICPGVCGGASGHETTRLLACHDITARGWPDCAPCGQWVGLVGVPLSSSESDPELSDSDESSSSELLSLSVEPSDESAHREEPSNKSNQIRSTIFALDGARAAVPFWLLSPVL